MRTGKNCVAYLKYSANSLRLIIVEPCNNSHSEALIFGMFWPYWRTRIGDPITQISGFSVDLADPHTGVAWGSESLQTAGQSFTVLILYRTSALMQHDLGSGGNVPPLGFPCKKPVLPRLSSEKEWRGSVIPFFLLSFWQSLTQRFTYLDARLRELLKVWVLN